MMRWLAHGVTLAVLMSIFGCVSSPTVNWASEKIVLLGHLRLTGQILFGS
jgi:hypothetical protein